MAASVNWRLGDIARARAAPSMSLPTVNSVWRLGMPTGTAKFRFVIGLNQISWLPRPCRTSVQPAARGKSLSARSNCGAIQLVAGSASRNAVICR